MKFFIFIFSIFVFISSAYFNFFPLKIDKKVSFLKAKNISFSLCSQDQLKGFFKAKDFIAKNSNFNLFNAANVDFTIYEENSSFKGHAGKLRHDEIIACTFFSDEVILSRDDPFLKLKGKSFVWNQNSLTFESQEEDDLILIESSRGKVKGSKFFWNQGKGTIALFGQVQGRFNEVQ